MELCTLDGEVLAVDAASGTYRSPEAGYRQAVNVLPLAFDAVPADARVAVGAGLVEDVEHRAPSTWTAARPRPSTCCPC
ncbi:hypothetical protein [Pseudonocardia lacus]|uniref:hypothetical protein n=1 Tax=Pseudonocardia lacus TaxID=2835865 RepID=UPI001BDC81C0|nr:hypothetical protein [Pseudonocardia lacus]